MSNSPKTGEPLFPLRKNSQYTAFLIIMTVVLLLSMLLATRLGSVDMSFDAIRKVLLAKVTGGSGQGIDSSM